MGLTFKQKINAYLGMSTRNIKLFFKDKTTLFFSMLAPIIVFALYILFLRNTYLSGLKSSLNGLENFINMADVDNVANLWLLSGILGTSCITVSLNSLQVMVRDKEVKVDFDYNSSPISGPIIVLAYFTGAFINTFLIVAGVLTVGLIVLSIMGTIYISAINVFLLYVVALFGCVSSTLIMMVVVSFFKKSSALGAFSGIISAAVGFMIGAYIPLGEFSSTVQGVLTLVPGLHISCLFRNLLMDGVINNINSSIGGIDSGEYCAMIRELFALKLNLFTYEVEPYLMYIYSGATSVLALIINIISYRLASKRS